MKRTNAIVVVNYNLINRLLANCHIFNEIIKIKIKYLKVAI
ncbi:MAG: hypothetical protein U9N59_00135 [Campylobacterota bacterium]|nr:hypothetical protein [Campylobacterota bacterium]